MKRCASWILAGGLLVAVAAGCGRKAEPKVHGSAPAVRTPPPALPEGASMVCEDNLLSVVFPSPAAATGRQDRVGLAAGTANTIVKTADGGRTWRRVLPRKADGPEFARLLFTGPAEGWAVSRDALLHTADTGETWTAAAPLPGNFYYFGPCAALAGDYGQMQPPGYGVAIHRTRDGGRTWQALPAPLPRNDYEALFFLDDRRGWVCGNYGRFALTADGGQTWQARDLPDGSHLVQVQFVTPEIGWARVEQGHDGGPLASADGGLSWRLQNAGVESFHSIREMQFLDTATGFLLVQIGADASEILRTLDGGATWARLATGPAWLASLCFVSPERGWAVGRGGLVCRFPR
jgi:photosystem II stability/assembly factor-like uncharacterized protein